MKISFDFDGTLSRESVQKYAKQLIDRDFNCIITTYRLEEYSPPDSNDDLFAVAEKLGINEVRFTEGKDKSSFLEEKGYIKLCSFFIFGTEVVIM